MSEPRPELPSTPSPLTPEQEGWLRTQLAGLAPECPRPHLPHLGDRCAICGRPVTDVLSFSWCEGCGRAMHFGTVYDLPLDDQGYLVERCSSCRQLERLRKEEGT